MSRSNFSVCMSCAARGHLIWGIFSRQLEMWSRNREVAKVALGY
jgi:hypothetical protein